MQNELNFDIKKHSDIDKTFRVNKIMSDLYSKQGFDVSIITSAKNLILGLQKDKNWTCTHYGKFKIDNKTADKGLKNSSSMGRRTASFTWRNNNG